MAEGYSGFESNPFDDFYNAVSVRQNIAERLFLMGLMMSFKKACREHQFYVEQLFSLMPQTPQMPSLRRLQNAFDPEAMEYHVNLSNNFLLPPKHLLHVQVKMDDCSLWWSYKKTDVSVLGDRYMPWPEMDAHVEHFFKSYKEVTNGKKQK